MPARLSGARGSIYLAGSLTKLADSYDWEYEETQDIHDCTIKGENKKRWAAGEGHSRVRIQSFVESPGTTSALTGPIMHTNQVAAHGVGNLVAFILDIVDGGGVATGTGYVIHSQLRVARDGIVTDEIEIQVDGDLAVL